MDVDDEIARTVTSLREQAKWADEQAADFEASVKRNTEAARGERARAEAMRLAADRIESSALRAGAKFSHA